MIVILKKIKITFWLYFAFLLLLLSNTYASIYTIPKQEPEYQTIYQKVNNPFKTDQKYINTQSSIENAHPFFNTNISTAEAKTNIVQNNFFSVTILKSNNINEYLNSLIKGKIQDILTIKH